MNRANQPGFQAGIPGPASCNPWDPITDFMAEMVMVPPQLLLQALQLRLPAPSLPLLRAKLQVIPLLTVPVELQPSFSKWE